MCTHYQKPSFIATLSFKPESFLPMTYTLTQLDALKHALATGERRVSFGDKTVEYRSIEELQAAIRTVEAELARESGTAATRQIRLTTQKGT